MHAALVALGAGSLLVIAGDAQADWIMEGSGRQIASFPMIETFDNEAYVPELVWLDDAIATFSHRSADGYNGSGAPQFNFVPNTGEDNTGLAFFTFPRSPGGVRHVSVRWLMLHGAGYFGGGGAKTLILQRCNNAGCDDQGLSGQRGMVMESAHPGAWDPYISENIEASGDEPIEIGKVPFDASSRPDEWISYEAEFDLDAGVARLFIDTLDGEQDSAGGTAPYRVWTNWDTSLGFRNLDWLTGYWEANPNAGPDAYYRVDELVIDTQYIGPPPDFHGGSSSASSSSSSGSGSSGTGGGSSASGTGTGSGSGNATSTSGGGGASGSGDDEGGSDGGDGCSTGRSSRGGSGLFVAALGVVALLGRARPRRADRRAAPRSATRTR